MKAKHFSLELGSQMPVWEAHSKVDQGYPGSILNIEIVPMYWRVKPTRYSRHLHADLPTAEHDRDCLKLLRMRRTLLNLTFINYELQASMKQLGVWLRVHSSHTTKDYGKVIVKCLPPRLKFKIKGSQ